MPHGFLARGRPSVIEAKIKAASTFQVQHSQIAGGLQTALQLVLDGIAWSCHERQHLAEVLYHDKKAF